MPFSRKGQKVDFIHVLSAEKERKTLVEAYSGF